jgi:hypothetical protein
MTMGSGANAVTLSSPIVTLGFANDIDYSLLADPKSGPKFGAAELVFVDWTRIENVAFIEQNPNFENPPLSQSLFDTLVFVASRDYPKASQGIFSPVDGAINSRAQIYFAPDSSTSFTNGPIVTLTSRGGNILRPGGNWDSDNFNDGAPWNLQMTSIEWDPSATAFGDLGPDSSEVPIPAGGLLFLTALGGAGWLKRRRR